MDHVINTGVEGDKATLHVHIRSVYDRIHGQGRNITSSKELIKVLRSDW